MLQIDGSAERTVQIDGSSDRIEAAKQLVNEVISDKILYVNLRWTSDALCESVCCILTKTDLLISI
ncbi:putative K domain, type 1 superfamily protein [Helianthus annuus]|nr:putative K domain, type 1 superfamily protein [Helianthus annuus]